MARLPPDPLQSAALRKELQVTLWPHFERAGFVRGKATSLFTPFRRNAEGAVHVFNIQWDKHHRPRFVINFGEVPASALPQVPAEDLQSLDLVHHSPAMLRLKRSRGGSMGSWFQLRKPLWARVSTFSWNYSPAEVAAQVAQHFVEVEAWWSTRAVGPHITVLRTELGGR